MKQFHAKKVHRGVLLLTIASLQFTNCSLISYRGNLDITNLTQAISAASELSSLNMLEDLNHFNEARFFLDNQDTIQKCENYIVTSIAAMGYSPAAIELQKVQLDFISLYDSYTGLWKNLSGPFFQNNIIITKPGSDPNLAPVLLGAHYDSIRWGPGANDNGSGCSVVLETARILQPKYLKRTVIFVFFAFEETGLQGSQAYVHSLANYQLPYRAIILDTIGFSSSQEYAIPFLPMPSTGDFLAVIGAQNNRSQVSNFQAINAALHTGLPVLGINADANVSSNLVSSNLLRSDHWSFWLRGCQAIFITDTANYRAGNHYHQASDTADTIDMAFLGKAGQSIVANVMYAANE